MPEPTAEELQRQLDEANASVAELQRQVDAMRAAMAMRSVRAGGDPGKTFRFYIDNAIKTDSKGVESGGDHVRVDDVEADSLDEAQKAIKLKKGEVVGQVVSVTFAEDLV